MPTSQKMSEPCPTCGEDCLIVVSEDGSMKHQSVAPVLFKANARHMDKMRHEIVQLRAKVERLETASLRNTKDWAEARDVAEQEVERLEADLEEAEQSHYIADLESRIAVVKECLSGIEWHGLTISVNHRSNVDRAILALRDIVPAAKDSANA